MKTYQQIQEGVYDPNIFKAVFLAGGPGSGKSFVVRQTTGGLGLKILNSDDIYEKDLEKAGLDAGKPEDIFSDEGQAIRGRSKEKTKKRQDLWVDGRLGIIIDGTGKDVGKISRQKSLLDQVGYDCYMIFVNTSLDIAQERNMMRKRKLQPKAVEQMWNAVQRNIGGFQRVFGSKNFIIVDNNENISDGDLFAECTKRIRGLVSGKPTKKAAQFWIKGELQKKSKAGGMFKGKIKTTGRRRGQKQLDVTDTGSIK